MKNIYWHWLIGGAVLPLTLNGLTLAADAAAPVANPRVVEPTGITPADRNMAEHHAMKGQVEVRQLGKLDKGEVYGNDGQRIGHIKGLAIDSGAGRIAYAVVEFDRLADIGDKQFAVPWRALDKKLDEKKFNKITFAMNANRDQLKNAKGIDKSNWPDMAQLKSEDAQGMWNVQPYWSETRVTVNADKGNARANVNRSDRDKARLQGSPVSAESGIILEAADLEGHRVLDESGKDVAKLGYVMADVHTGRLVYGILEFSMTSSDLNPVPFELIRVDSTGKDQEKTGVAKDGKAFNLVLTTSVDKVKSGPKFTSGGWPDMTPAWGETVYSAYGITPFWSAAHAKHAQ